MNDLEKQTLEARLNMKAFQDAMFDRISPENLINDGVRFEHKTVQLVFESYLEGAKPNPVRVIGQQLYAEIKPTSKYASQAEWMRARDQYPFAVRFQADSLGYIVKGGIGGQYRMEDVDLLFKFGDEFHRIK